MEAQPAADMSAESYHYSPLLEGTIRVLLLQPSSTFDDPVQILLETRDLQESTDAVEAPQDEGNQSDPHGDVPLESASLGYEALSYCWGDQTRLHTIWCHDRSVEVRENLYHALLRLRKPRDVRRLWIDALCINQSDNDEKSHQVFSMAKIFSGASRGIIWLGEDSELNDGALSLEFFRKCWEAWSELSEDEQRKSRYEQGEFDLYEKARERMDGISEDFLGHRPSRWNRDFTGYKIKSWPKPLSHFFQRSWFGRLWVVQEVFASRDPIVMCGKSELPWQVLQDIFRPFYGFIRPWSGEDALWSQHDNDADGGILKACRLLTHEHLKRDDIAGLYNIEQFCDFDCADHRDRIYALLSLIPIQFPPDYHMSVESVYHSFARHCINFGVAVWLLSCAELCLERSGGSSRSTLPSWVPDWRVHPGEYKFVLGRTHYLLNSKLQISFEVFGDGHALLVRSPASCLDVRLMKRFWGRFGRDGVLINVTCEKDGVTFTSFFLQPSRYHSPPGGDLLARGQLVRPHDLDMWEFDEPCTPGPLDLIAVKRLLVSSGWMESSNATTEPSSKASNPSKPRPLVLSKGEIRSCDEEMVEFLIV